MIALLTRELLNRANYLFENNYISLYIFHQSAKPTPYSKLPKYHKITKLQKKSDFSIVFSVQI